MRITSCTPSSTSISRGSPVLPPTAPMTVRNAPVERWMSNPMPTSSAMTRSTSSGVARSLMTTTMSILSLYVSLTEPLQPPGFVDDPFEQPFHGAVVERSAVDCLHVRQHLGLTGRLIHLEPQTFFLRANGQRAFGAGVEQAHERLVDLVDPLTKLVDPLHSALLSHRTYSRTASGASGPFCPIKLTMALPTTAASALRQAAATCSGREIPNPIATGSALWRRSRSTSAAASGAISSRCPVTPSLEMTYRNPRPSSADCRMRWSVVVGLIRKIGSRPASMSGCRIGSASSTG